VREIGRLEGLRCRLCLVGGFALVGAGTVGLGSGAECMRCRSWRSFYRKLSLTEKLGAVIGTVFAHKGRYRV
jgi:hypothetical protein